MIMHYLLTLPYITITLLLLSYTRAKQFAYYFCILFIGILCNIPFYHHLSLNDLTYSITSNLSFFTLILCALLCLEILQFKKKKIFFISYKGYFYIAFANLFFYLCFLNVIPLNIYYTNHTYTILIASSIIFISFFFDKIVALVYLFCLFAYNLGLFEVNNIFDYFFDVPILITTLIALCIKSFQKIKK